MPPSIRLAHPALLTAVLLASGCTALFDPGRLTYDDRVDAGRRDAGPPDPDTDGGPVDGGIDGGPPTCGAVGEACCASPSPACVAGANCTLEGCQPCGGPGQACCESGRACEVLSCLDDTSTCPPVTPLVPVAVPGGGTYGVDAYEVSREQYEAWLATSPTPTGALVATGCGGNTDFTPSAACVAGGYGCTGASCVRHPQTCLDWCDAFAYCAAVGKQLCGGYAGGGVSPSSFTEASQSAWYNACSSGGLHDFTTGDGGSVGDSCQFMDLGAAVEVDSLTACQSPIAGYEGVLALTGNVREWVHACDGIGMDAGCLAVGGAFLDDDFYVGQCNYPHSLTRTFANPSTGFRCCELR